MRCGMGVVLGLFLAFGGSSRHASALEAGAGLGDVTGTLRVAPITDESYVAAWIDVPAGAKLVGVRWWCGGSSTVFPRLLTLTSGGSELAPISECSVLAENVETDAIGMGECEFDAPADVLGEGMFLIIKLPIAADFLESGEGVYAGIGFVRDAGLRGWVTVDGQHWVGLDRSYGLAVEPVFNESISGGALKMSAARDGEIEGAGVRRGMAAGILSVTPNPFNPSTKIRFALEVAGHITVLVYDIRGRRVASLLDAMLSAGLHEVTWDGRDETLRRVASGVYVAHLITADCVSRQRMVLCK